MLTLLCCLVQHTQQCMIIRVVPQGWPQNLEISVVVGMQPSAYSLEFFDRCMCICAHALGSSADAMTTFCLHARDVQETCHHHLTRVTAMMHMAVPPTSMALLN